MTEGSLFAAALSKRSPEERAAFLDEVCAGIPALRRELEALLKAHDEAGSFLRQPDDSAAATVAPSTGAAVGRTQSPRPVPETPGTCIGPKLLQQIGEGGMGSVWMAEQATPVRRIVALKVIKAGMDSAQVVARFEAERQALALMDHPHIAKVLDAGSTETGRPYFVMELVKGTPITRYCDDQRLTIRERLQLFIPVCQALQHAHQKGIIHRDIKPSNVLVAPYDGQPVVKVIDFGVAKATGQRLTENTLFTEFGAVIGTLEYMSPEQAELNNQDIDTRSDIYSLGVLLYELLTGTTPLNTQRLHSSAFAAILQMIQHEEPPRPSTRLSDSRETLPSMSAQRQTDPARLPRLVRGDLDWIVMRALEKNRGRRYESANGMARDIERYLNEEPVEACPPSATYRMRKFAHKHRAALFTAAALVGLLALGTIVSTWQAIRARRMEYEAMAERDRAIAAQIEVEQARQGEANEKKVVSALARAQTLASQKAIAEAAKAHAAANAEADARRAEAEQRQKAEASATQAQRALYFNSISLAHQHWLGDNLALADRILKACPDPMRGWEWRYLWGLNHADLLTLPGNGQFTTGLQFSKDGKRLAAFARSGDAGVRVWDLTANKVVTEFSLSRNHRQFKCCGISPDGKTIALGDSTGQISFWDVDTGRLIREFVKSPRPPVSLAFSSDGLRLVAAWADSRNGERLFAWTEPPRNLDLIVWEVATGKELFHPKGYGAGAEFSSDGSRLLTFRANTAFRLTSATPEFLFALFDTTAWTEVAAGQLGSGQSFSFSGDGKQLALGGRDRQRDSGFVRVVDLATAKERLTLEPKAVRDLALSPDGNSLVVVGAFGTSHIEVWDLKTKTRAGTIRGHTDSINAAVFSPDGRLATCSWDNTIKLWDPVSGQALRILAKPSVGQATPTALGPGGKIFAYGQFGTVSLLTGPVQTIVVLDAATGRTLHTLAGHEGGTQRLAFGSEGTRLASGGAAGDAKIWDLAKGTMLSTYGGRQERTSALALSPDGTLAACAHESKEHAEFARGTGSFKETPAAVHVWNVGTGKERWILKGHSVQVHAIAFGPDGQLLASADYRGTKLWDLKTGKCLRDLNPSEFQSGSHNGLQFSRDGTLLATAGSQKAQVWNVATGRSVALFEGHQKLNEGGLAFSPDQSRLATAGGREVKVWDVQSGQEAVTLRIPESEAKEGSSPVAALAWSDDGQRLRAALRDGSVVEWATSSRRE